MGFTLQDDGTLDTVIKCDECGEMLRYDSGQLVDTMQGMQKGGLIALSSDPSEARVELAIVDAQETHECREHREGW